MVPCMESYGSMHFHVWNHMIPCVELHERSVGHSFMHGIVWNHTDHMLPCMELHGSLMNLDPGIHNLLLEKTSVFRTLCQVFETINS